MDVDFLYLFIRLNYYIWMHTLIFRKEMSIETFLLGVKVTDFNDLYKFL